MAKSAVDIAIENIDTDIASLQQSKDIIIAASKAAPVEAPKVRKPRGKNKPKPGLPASEGI